MFEIIPAVDIRKGRCVRLQRGCIDAETVFSDDPVDAALRWQDEGANILHVVDLDGAFSGKPENIGVISRIIGTVSVPVEVGGGIRDTLSVSKYLEIGAARVVVGTKAFADPKWFKALAAEYGGRVVAGLDGRRGRAAVSGWKENTGMSVLEAVTYLCELGAKRIIYTDVSRDGMMGGPNLLQIEQVARASSVPVIASGGIASVQDILSVAKLEPLGVEGVIVGMALYRGAFSLKEAVDCLKGVKGIS